MNDSNSYLKNTVIYALSIICPVIAFLCAFLNVTTFLFEQKGNPILSCILTFIVIKTSFKVRTEFRMRYEQGNIEKDPAKAFKYKSKAEREQYEKETYRLNEAALSEKEFRSMVHSGSMNPDKELDKLIGLQQVRDKVLELKADMQYKDKKEIHGFNMCMLGNPGTGKTTVTGIIAAYLYKYKFIKNNKYIVVDGSTLVSSADPSRRINLLLKKSKGKVLFIDEAYALAYSPNIGAGILSTIISEMEEDRKNTIVIFAGYKKEMQNLFKMNSGLESRISSFLFFNDYNNEELLQIVSSMCNDKGYEVDDNAFMKMLDVFEELRNSGTFANARSARNVADSAISRHRVRQIQHLTDDNIINAEDVVLEESKNNYFADMNF